jgi:hypothetical protein
MRITTEHDNAASTIVWIHETTVDDVVVFRSGRCGATRVADWPGVARLTCTASGSGAQLTAAPGVSPRVLGKLRDGAVRALLRDLQGELALHASAVAVGGYAVLFVGPSGAGKSTAAAEMCLLHSAQLLADDIALLEVRETGVVVLPSEADHYLAPDSCVALGIPPEVSVPAGRKGAMRSSAIASGAYPLALVVELRFHPASSESGSAIRQVRGHAAALSLLTSAIRFDVEDAVARRRELEQVMKVYEHAGLVGITRPRASPGRIGALVVDALAEKGR